MTSDESQCLGGDKEGREGNLHAKDSVQIEIKVTENYLKSPSCFKQLSSWPFLSESWGFRPRLPTGLQEGGAA